MRYTSGLVLAVTLIGCWEGGGSRAALQNTLDQERRAHLEADAGLLVELLDDTVVSVERGQIVNQPREMLETVFTSYFQGATYEKWDDLEAPKLTVSPDGLIASVHRRVEVARSAVRGAETVREAFTSSWIATYRWDGDQWLMTAIASAQPDPSEEVLGGAVRGLGPAEVVSSVQQVGFQARVNGPGGAFTVNVLSARDRRARIEFTPGMTMGIEPAGGWRVEEGGVGRLSTREVLFVRGHELLIKVIAPGTRFQGLFHAGATVFDGKAAIRLSGADALGGAVDVYYSEADTVLLGFQVEDHLRGAGPVTVALSEWRDAEGLSLPHAATFVQGSERFDYDIFRVELSDSTHDGAFARPTP